MKKRFGFTLAEVLITLGIIGVVSMMVLPTIKGETEKIVTMAQLKHSYSTLQNAIRMSEYHNGKIKRWDMKLSGSEFFHKYIKSYLKYSNEYSKEQLKAMNITRTLLNGQKYTGTTFSGSSSGSTYGKSYIFELLDGSTVAFNLNAPSDNGIWVGIDVNGFNPPNRIGRDTFLFFISPNYGMQPFGGLGTPNKYGWNYGKEYKREKIMNSSSACACNKNAPRDAGYWCTALIINDGWKISKDYPWSKVKK